MKVRFINFERTKLPEEILRHNLEEKRKYFSDICLEVERSDAEVQVCLLSLSPMLYFHMIDIFLIKKLKFLMLNFPTFLLFLVLCDSG